MSTGHDAADEGRPPAADREPDGVAEDDLKAGWAAPETSAELRGAIEAILLVVDEPAPQRLIAQVLGAPEPDVAEALASLQADYDASARGFELREVGGGWRLYTREVFARYVERFVLDGQQARLTQAALETLAVIAYKQPVTRSRISAIRGVAVDGVIRTLLTRGLIEECGAEPDTGAHLYRTTLLFLEKLGLDTLGELPPLAPLLPDLDSLDDVISPSA
jgi:segregation and condensation protein B